MSDFLYSPSMRGFYREDFHQEIPSDVVPVRKEEHQRLFNEVAQTVGAVIEPGEGGYPTVRTPPPLSVDELRKRVEISRKSAYADPSAGSDALFAEASRMQIMGEPGWEAVRDAAIARYQDIQAALPWPEEQL